MLLVSGVVLYKEFLKELRLANEEMTALDPGMKD